MPEKNLCWQGRINKVKGFIDFAITFIYRRLVPHLKLRSGSLALDEKNGFTRVAKFQQMCGKYHICTILLKFAQEQRLMLH